MDVLITTSSFGTFDKQPIEILKKNGFNVIINPFQRKLTEDEVLSLLLEYKPSCLLAGVEPLTQKVLAQSKDFLRVISRCGIGMDSVDLEAAKEFNIKVFNTPDAPTRPVAELTLGLILALLRKIAVSDRSIRQGHWERPMGNLLYKKTIGIIGCGRIGTCLASFLKPFECSIIGFDPFIKEHSSIKLVSKESLIGQSDLITLHIPYNKENKHIINAQSFSQMKEGAFLVNASRGGLVDEKALIQSLKEGRLAGAALDCFENEPYSGELTGFDNVVLTSHIGSYAKEGRIIQELEAANNIINAMETFE